MPKFHKKADVVIIGLGGIAGASVAGSRGFIGVAAFLRERRRRGAREFAPWGR